MHMNQSIRDKMEPMFERPSRLPFQEYPKAGAWLTEQGDASGVVWAEARKIRPDLS